MGIIRRLTDLQLGSIATSKVVSLNSSGYVFQIGSGNRSFEATNLGGATVYYGDAVRIGTGGVIQSQGAKFWDTIVDNFTMTFYIGSGGFSNLLVIQEYAGN